MSTAVAIIALAIVGVLAALARYWQRRSELFAIGQRPSLTDDEIFQTFYAASGLRKEHVMEGWREDAAELKLPSDKLRPQDRFGKEIGRYLITSDNLHSLSQAARRRAKAHGVAIDLSKISNVDEYVRTFAIGRHSLAKNGYPP